MGALTSVSVEHSKAEDRPTDEKTPDGLPPLPSPTAKKMAEIPSEKKQREVIAQIEEVFMVSQATTREKKLKCANELFAFATESSKNSAETYCLLRVALDLAVEGGDAHLALKAIDQVSRAFAVDTRKAKLATLS